MILDPGFSLTLRPMKYPVFFDMYKTAIKNGWTVEEVDFATDITDLATRMTPAERHLIHRLVAFPPPAIRSFPTISCSTFISTSTRPRRASTSRANFSKKRCTSNSI